MKDRYYVTDILNEALILKRIPEKGKLVVVSDLPDPRKASSETFTNKEALKANGFTWGSREGISAWICDDSFLNKAQSSLNAINKTSSLISSLSDIESMVTATDAPDKTDLSSRIKLFIEDLANATDEAAADAKIKQYLNFFGKLKKRSFTNNILIFIQNPDATHVEGYRTWQTKYNRQVKKGAKAITIFAPITTKSQESTPSDEAAVDKGIKTHNYVSFRPVSVFDIADTEVISGMEDKANRGMAPQWFDPNTPSDTADKLFDCTVHLMAEMGIRLTSDGSKGGEKGFSAGDHINLSSNIEGVARASTAIHELAHELMHWKKTSPFYDEENLKGNNTRALMELQAESVSYTVLRNYDIPVKHHATYLALWKANTELIKNNMHIISDVAKFIIEKIDTYMDLDVVSTESNNDNTNKLNEQIKKIRQNMGLLTNL